MNREPNTDELKRLALRHPAVSRHGFPTPEHAGEYCINIYADASRDTILEDLGWTDTPPDLTLIIRGISATLIASATRTEIVKDPSIAVMLKSLTSTAVGIASDLFGGLAVMADDDTLKARRAVCGQCAYASYTPADTERIAPSCLKCGCATNRKTLFKASQCPEGFWTA